MSRLLDLGKPGIYPVRVEGQAFLDQVLCPKLRPGHVVVMDNLSAHKVDGVRQRIEACGASVLYLPPYSPDLTAIEKAWSKLKARLRALAARAMPQLEYATVQALHTITAQDAQAWLRLRFGTLHLKVKRSRSERFAKVWKCAFLTRIS